MRVVVKNVSDFNGDSPSSSLRDIPLGLLIG
jgi:hypothetical protein